MKSILLIAFMLSVISTAHAEKLAYPACLKPEGGWLQHVTRKQCVGKDVHGKWITMKQFKKLRNKVL